MKETDNLSPIQVSAAVAEKTRFSILEYEFNMTGEQIHLLATLISSIGNSEAKAAGLISMEKNTFVGPSTLRRQFIEMTGGVWPTTERTQTDYCRKTLEPIGLVVHSAVFRPGAATETTYYAPTQLAEVKGKPLAGYLIAQSNECDLSLYRLFGETHTPLPEEDPKPRPPITRFQIIGTLSRRPARLADLEAKLGLSRSSLLEHLSALKSLRIIRARRKGHEKFYKIAGNNLAQKIAFGIIPTVINFIKGEREAVKTVRNAYHNLMGSKDLKRKMATAVQRARENSSQANIAQGTPPQFRIVELLESHPEGMLVEDIATNLDLKRSSLYSLLGKLREAGSVVRGGEGWPRPYFLRSSNQISITLN